MSSGAERQAHLVIHPWVEGTVELWGHCVVCALSWFEVYVKGPYTAHSRERLPPPDALGCMSPTPCFPQRGDDASAEHDMLHILAIQDNRFHFDDD